MNQEFTHYVRKFGNATSIGLLHPLSLAFQIPSVDGIIAYRQELGTNIAIGDPLCTFDEKIILARTFYEFSLENKKKSIFLLTSDFFTQELLQLLNGSALQVGHEIIIDPTIDTRLLTGNYPRHLRHKYKHAQAHAIHVYEFMNDNNEIKEQLATFANQWLARRKGPQAYLLPLDIFSYASEKRWFYAQQKNDIIGLLMINRINPGWVLSGSIMVTKDAPTSTSAFLMMKVLEKLRQEHCTFFSIGPTISTEIGRIEGFGIFWKKLIYYSMKSARTLFKLNNRQQFWEKFQPRKEPSFFTFTTRRIKLQEVRAILRFFHVNI